MLINFDLSSDVLLIWIFITYRVSGFNFLSFCIIPPQILLFLDIFVVLLSHIGRLSF
jgi:hypothetical protein